MSFPGTIAIIGGGTWATALAKIILIKQRHINWFLRREDQIEGFKKHGKNPSYLSNVSFNTDRITFFSDMEEIVKASDTLIIAVPSPFLKSYLTNVKEDIFNDKFVISAVKGIIPPENLLVTDYFIQKHGVKRQNLAIVGGPCHAEEIAMERQTYPTIACEDIDRAKELSEIFNNRFIKCSYSSDVCGIETAAVLKNVYAIASGICHGLKYGDNFQAVLVSNAIQEMGNFVSEVSSEKRNIKNSEYLGDLLVTAYSGFSRNRTFGSMIGKGYSVKAAQMEMEMIAEGYYGTKCIHEMNLKLKVNMPIAETVYKILYEDASAKHEIKRLAEFTLK